MKAFEVIDIPGRSRKPRGIGLTVVLDRGIGYGQAEDLVEYAAEYIDAVKLGWGVARLMPAARLKKKISLYKKYDILVTTGGTLFEIACIQKKVDQFLDCASDLGFNLIEVSNGAVPVSLKERGEWIRRITERGFIVFSEVGKKDPVEDKKLTLSDRLREMESDLAFGAAKVIVEARESGKGLGIYDEKGEVMGNFLEVIAGKIGMERVILEAPEKKQQASLIARLGREVNLGNIRPDDVIPLESLRCGLRYDTMGKSAGSCQVEGKNACCFTTGEKNLAGERG